MTILEIIIVFFILIAVIVFMARRKKKQPLHIHSWVFMYKYKDGLNEYGRYYCSGCLKQCITYFNSRKGIIELTVYNAEEIIKEK